MITMIAHHEVTDWEIWMSAAKANMANAERFAQLNIVGTSKAYRTADGSGAIVIHTFKDLESAQNYENMLQSAEGQAMLEKNSGGKHNLTVWIAEDLSL